MTSPAVANETEGFLDRSKKITVKHPEFGEREEVVTTRVPTRDANSGNPYESFERYFGGPQDFEDWIQERIINAAGNNYRAAVTKAAGNAKTQADWDKVIKDGLETALKYTVRTGLTAAALRESAEEARSVLAGKSIEEIAGNQDLIAAVLKSLKLPA